MNKPRVLLVEDAPAPRLDGPDVDRAHVIEAYFDGDLALFESYRATCLAQFPNDIQEGDAASASSDLRALHLVAHSLKSVLLTLGFPQWSAEAQALEDSSHSGMLAPSLQQWTSLRGHVSQLFQGD